MPNYFKHLNSLNEPKIDKIINSVRKKKRFNSKILNKKFQNILFKEVSFIKNYHGIRKTSDVVFFKKI